MSNPRGPRTNSIIICLWNSPYYTHSKQRSLNNSKRLCLYMYILSSSHQIQVLFKFLFNIQGHAGSCNLMQYYASFLILFFVPCPECSSLSYSPRYSSVLLPSCDPGCSFLNDLTQSKCSSGGGIHSKKIQNRQSLRQSQRYKTVTVRIYRVHH